MRAAPIFFLFALFAYLAISLTFASRPPHERPSSNLHHHHHHHPPPPPPPPVKATASTVGSQSQNPLLSPLPPRRRQTGHRYHKDEYHDKMAAASEFYAYKRGKELEYFPGVGMVEPLGLITVSAIPLLVLFAVFWLILPFWIRMIGVGFLPSAPGLVPGTLIPGAPVAPASAVVAGRRRRDITGQINEQSAKLLQVLDDTVQRYSKYARS